jgi:hypothetical protein
MTKKKTKKKITKKVKLSEEEREELATEGELPKKAVRKSEDRQLVWFVGIIVFVFVLTLGIYFWVEGAKTFEFGGVEWVYEDDVDYYHGRFENLLGADVIYNIYLKNDPRENNVTTKGVFDKFKYGVVISTSPEFDSCRGDASRVMRDLGAFMREGFGAGPLESGSTDEEVAVGSERRFATCDSIDDRTVIIVERGYNFVAQDVDNPNCYIVSIGDCNDASPVEKFMLKVIEDFGGD